MTCPDRCQSICQQRSVSVSSAPSWRRFIMQLDTPDVMACGAVAGPGDFRGR